MHHNPEDLSAEIDRLCALSGIKWSRYPKGTLAAWVADMDLPVAPVIAEALRGLVERGDFGYNFGALQQLPGAWAEWTGRRHGWRPDVERVHVTTDVLQAVDLALWFGTEPGDGVVLLTPVYPPFFTMVTDIGRRVVDCPLEPGTWRLDVERLEACIDSSTRCVLLCSPHNPTGRAFTAEELGAIAEVAERHDLLVISDEIWADMVFSGATHVPFEKAAEGRNVRAVTVGAASKAFNVAGLRCAVAHFGDADLEKRVCELPGHMLGGVSAPGALATHVAFTRGEPWLAETVRFLEAQRDYVVTRLRAELPDAVVTVPEATYLAWVDLRAYELGDDPAAVLLERAQVALGSGPDFGVHGKGFARINFATSKVVLEEVVGRVTSALP